MVPPSIDDHQASFDESTPEGLDKQNSGFIKYIYYTNDEGKEEVMGGLLTQHGVDRYNALIASYRLQMEDQYKIELKQGDGVIKYKDQSGFDAFYITARHLKYFMRMNNWSKVHKPEDSLWMKTKDKIGL